MSEAWRKGGGNEITERRISIDCIQWKLDECRMFRAVPFRLEKNLSQVERSSSPKPGRYSG